jgi:hypothetical protein
VRWNLEFQARNSGTPPDGSRYVPGAAAFQEITMRYAIALSAVLTALALSGPASAQSVQSGKYCLNTKDGGPATANCSFQTMAACEKSKTGKNDICSPNRQTTGSGPSMKDQKKQQ